MTDDLDKLRDALKGDLPAPDVQNRARNIEAAKKIFTQSQGSEDATRPMFNQPQNEGGIWTRIKEMLNGLTAKPILLASSSFAVLALAVLVTTQTSVTDNFAVPEVDTLVDSNDMVASRQDKTLASETSSPVQAAPMEGLVAPMAMDPAPMVESFAGESLQRSVQTRSKVSEGAIQLDLSQARIATPAPADVFPENTPSGLKLSLQEPVSTFSVDVDTTSYALMRMATLDGYPLPPEAIRVEEMINYFDYDYATPDSTDIPFSTSVSVMETPWNPDTQLMQIGIESYDLNPADRPPMGLVFLIDTSGSMENPMKLPLLRKSFGLLLNTLRDEDTVSIVTYAGSAGMALEPTKASEKEAILSALDTLSAGGSTAGQAGLQQAYSIAEDMQENGQQARIILATDGDFNVGISDPKALTDYVAEKRETGVFLSVLGFGRGNYTDTIMQAIAQNGNGVAAYIDSLAEAQKVLVEEVTGSLITIASDVKIQVEFNPAQISEYRLIGYETRALNREDFNNDKVDAGEIGAGHTVTAIYEITPVGSPAELADPLRYAAGNMRMSPTDPSNELAFVKLRYKQPGEAISQLVETPVMADTQVIPTEDANFAASVAAAGQIMRGQDLGDYTIKDAQALAAANRGEDRFGHRAEFVRLLKLIEAQ